MAQSRVLQAYMQGVQQRIEAQRYEEERKLQAEAEKVRQKEREENLKRQDEILKYNQQKEIAERKLNQLQAGQEFGTNYTKTGSVPQGGKLVGSEEFEFAPGKIGKRDIIEVPEFGQFSAVNPMTQIEIDLYKNEQIQAERAGHAEELERIRNEGRAEIARAQQQAMLDKLDQQFEYNKELITLRGQTNLNNQLATIGERARLTREASGNKLSVRAAEVTVHLQDAERISQEVTELLNQYGWESYFKGGLGGGQIGELLRRGNAAPNEMNRAIASESIRAKLGQLALIEKNIQALGASLTGNEQALLGTFAPMPSETDTIQAGIAKLQSYPIETRAKIKNLLGVANGVFPTTQTPPVAPNQSQVPTQTNRPPLGAIIPPRN